MEAIWQLRIVIERVYLALKIFCLKARELFFSKVLQRCSVPSVCKEFKNTCMIFKKAIKYMVV